MGSLIFVHGTGVREEQFKDPNSIIGQNLMAKRTDTALFPCLWGEKHGAKLNLQGASIPNYETTRAVGDFEEEDLRLALWALLYDDPLSELRSLGLLPEPLIKDVTQQAAYPQLLAAGNALSLDGSLEELVRQSGLADVWDKAHGRVAASNEYHDALRNAPAASDEYLGAIARAIVAQAIDLALDPEDESETLPINGAQRDRLVEALVDRLREKLGGDDYGILGGSAKKMSEVTKKMLGWVAKQVVLRPVSRYAKNRRGRFSDKHFAEIGDILVYQARGKGICDFILDTVKKAPEPVILLAHSLGGIASVDLLNLESLPKVKLLITVGSQAPLLYEIGALSSLEFGKPLSERFPKRWLNIYDPRDFLSYQAQAVFEREYEGQRLAGKVKITDREVDNGEPFPQAHGAYWKNREVWDVINKALDETYKESQ